MKPLNWLVCGINNDNEVVDTILNRWSKRKMSVDPAITRDDLTRSRRWSIVMNIVSSIILTVIVVIVLLTITRRMSYFPNQLLEHITDGKAVLIVGFLFVAQIFTLYLLGDIAETSDDTNKLLEQLSYVSAPLDSNTKLEVLRKDTRCAGLKRASVARLLKEAKKVRGMQEELDPEADDARKEFGNRVRLQGILFGINSDPAKYFEADADALLIDNYNVAR